MSADDFPPPPLDEDARDAVAGARSLGGPEADVRRRMRARLVSAMVALPGGGGTEGGGGTDGGAPPGAAGAGAAGGAGIKVSLWVVAMALVVGAGIGWVARRPPEAVVTAAPVASHTPTALPSAESVASAPAATVRPQDLPTVPNAVTSRPPPDLAAERALLDVARTALGRGAGGNALAACDDHARKYPRGSLAEEREAIAVQALVLEGRNEDARARAERFRRTHPRSIFLPAVLAAAGVDP
jgi:hypothetical protein